MKLISCAVTQFACSSDKAANLDKAESIVRSAAAKGAQLILLQELFEGMQIQQGLPHARTPARLTTIFPNIMSLLFTPTLPLCRAVLVPGTKAGKT
jgi:predicted amidohydrolase